MELVSQNIQGRVDISINQSKMSTIINLGKKLTFLVFMVSIVAISITGVLSFNYADQILDQRTGDQLLGESTVMGETLRLLFESRIRQNSILTNDPAIQLLVVEMNQATQDEFEEIMKDNRESFLAHIQTFQELIGFSIGFEDTKIVGSGGSVLFSLSTNTETSLAGNPLFQRGLKESFVEFEPFGSGKKMIVASPIFAEDSKNGDESIGVIISRMRTASIDDVLSNRSGLGESGEVYIVNDQSFMLSESRFLEDVVYKQKVETLPVQRCFDDGKEFLGVYENYRNVSIYGSSYCADDLGIVLLVEIDKAEVEKPIAILQDRILHTGILITVGMGVVAFLISKSLSRPLRKLRNAANKIAGGDFEVRTNIKTGDEIGELSHAFDSMAQKLQESLVEIKEKDDVIKQQEGILLKFSQHVQNDCVGVIDMKNSTKISSELSDQSVAKMYEIFLNFMAKIVRKYNGEVVKNIGDALMFRFANVNPDNPDEMKNMLECCLAMIDSHEELKEQLNAEGTPGLDYKISATYGPVSVAQSATSNISDIFGPTVNKCFKINSLCPKNSVVIGINMYKILKTFTEYEFIEFSSNEMQEKYGYSIFEVKRKN